MAFNLFSGPLFLLLFALVGWFGYQYMHKRRIGNGADPQSKMASCLLTAVMIGVPALLFGLYWLNSNWTN